MATRKRVRKRKKPMDLHTLASIGGKARAKALTKAERRAISRKGGLAARGIARRKYRPRKRKK